MSDQHFSLALVLASAIDCAIVQSWVSLGLALSAGLIYISQVYLARERDERLNKIRDDFDKQLAALKDKLDSVLIRGNR